MYIQSPFRQVMPLAAILVMPPGSYFGLNKTRLLSKWMGRESELHFHWSPRHKNCM